MLAAMASNNDTSARSLAGLIFIILEKSGGKPDFGAARVSLMAVSGLQAFVQKHIVPFHCSFFAFSDDYIIELFFQYMKRRKSIQICF